MAYCDICDSTTCSGYHPLGGRVCENCGEDEIYLEGLCRNCWRYEHDTGARFRPRPDICTRAGCSEYVYQEGQCYIHYTYRS